MQTIRLISPCWPVAAALLAVTGVSPAVPLPASVAQTGPRVAPVPRSITMPEGAWDLPGPGYRAALGLMSRHGHAEAEPFSSVEESPVPMRLNPDRIEIEVELRRKHMKLLRFSSGGGRSQHLPLEDFEILPPNHLLPELAIISGTAYGDPVYEYLDPPNPVPEDGLSPVVKISHSFEPFDFHRHQTTVVKEAVAEAAGFPGEIVDEVIVPVPSEVFLVLDKLGKPDWKAELRSAKRVAPPQRIDAALLLGMVVGEGFVAVQAQDQEAVENVGRDVLKLAESLGLKDVVQEHCQEILNASKKNHWEIVRVELDKTQKTVRDTMEKRRDQELAHCVSLGGWLRGTEAVTDLITKNYTSDAAELLNQPDIVKHFRKQVGPMGAKSAKLKSIVAGLEEIGHVIGAGDEPPSASGVQTIQGVAARLVKEINTQTQKTK